jgi:hypothetical protein
MALVLGLAAGQSASLSLRELGLVLFLGGAAGLLWQLRLLWLQWQEERATEAAIARRTALLAARRERTARERARRLAQKEARATAEQRLSEARSAQKQAAILSTREEATRHARREREIGQEVARLQALSDAALVAEVGALLTERGLRPERPEREAVYDLLLTAPAEGVLEVARCVPQRQKAGAVDVEALETWRSAVGARHAYLVSLAGFSPAAVRLVRHLPMTLVEAHLLAHWRQAVEK